MGRVCWGWYVPITSLGSRLECLWIGRPGWRFFFPRSRTEGTELHSSASTVKSSPVFCSGGHNLGFRSNHADSLCVTEEHWTSSTLSTICSGIHGSSPNQSTCGSGGGVWPCPSTHVVGGALGLKGPGPSDKVCSVPVWMEQESALHCWQ